MNMILGEILSPISLPFQRHCQRFHRSAHCLFCCVRIPRCRLDVRVIEKLLGCCDTCSSVENLCAIAVAKYMGRYLLLKTSFHCILTDHYLHWPRSWPYKAFRRHFGMNTTWYLHSHTLWFKLPMSSIMNSLSKALGGSRTKSTSDNSWSCQTVTASPP